MEKANIHENTFVAPGAVVLGKVTLSEECSVWYNATVRGDRERVIINKGSNVQDNAVVHVEDGYGVVIGRGVTIGHGAIVHGCNIDDNTLIGMGAIILNGAKIGKNCIIGAGALVTQNTIIPDNSLVIGNPGKVLRQVSENEIQTNRHNAQAYIEESKEYKSQY